MRTHERSVLVNEATAGLTEAIAQWVISEQTQQLTGWELLKVLVSVPNSIAQEAISTMIKAEREGTEDD